jgi:hypothetical protein
MKVIVIGCGPAGLAAAHAAAGHGCDVDIYAPKLKTPQEGPLLIQRPIPGINNDHPDGTIHQRVIGGSIMDYRYKLYGDVNIGINGDILRSEYHAWNHRETYHRLWNIYSNLIHDRKVTPIELKHLHDKCDLVVSTANAYMLCNLGSHIFRDVRVAVTSQASYPNQPDDTIIFNAGNEYDWIRSSNIFGVEVTEWMVRRGPQGARIIKKPVSTDCTCYPRVLRTGRFGAWRNETWVDTAYWDTYSAIASMLRKDELDNIK